MTEEHQTKQNIRIAARRLFAERGYNAVSMRDIAQAINKQQGGLYNHFGSKQAILVDLMRENLTKAHAFAIAPLDDTARPSLRLEQFVRRHVEYNIDNPDDIFIAYMELRSLDAEGTKEITRQRDDYEAALRKILEDGRVAGDFTLSNPAIHARSILAMLGGVIVWYKQSGARSPQDIAECYVQAALQSVGSHYSPPAQQKG
jgi:AcrR family transcriptional regulator